ncbi:unnamed protein product, partial [Tilletia caries]
LSVPIVSALSDSPLPMRWTSSLRAIKTPVSSS